jgi:polysaccharide export outer membrane protein
MIANRHHMVAILRQALILICSCLYSVLSSSAQTKGPTAPTEPFAAYVLGVDDQIVIRALDVDEIDGRMTRVDLRGYVDVPLLGNVKASGLNVEELELQLTKRLAKYVREPRVTVTVSEYRSQPVSVLGAVNTPGVYNLTGTNTLAQVLSKAGGLRGDAGNTIRITRGHAWGPIPLSSARSDPSAEFSTAEVGVKSLLEAKDPQDNILVKPTDVISVPRAELVYVVGDVHRPGGFVLNERESMTVLQAVSMAEGLEKTSAAKNAKILRGGATKTAAEIPVDLVKILSGRSSDVPLLANDILFVPNSAAKSAALRSIEAVIQAGTGIAIFRR